MALRGQDFTRVHMASLLFFVFSLVVCNVVRRDGSIWEEGDLGCLARLRGESRRETGVLGGVEG
jgi:hypothetical protein